MHTQDLITRYMSPVPGAVTRLGANIFIEVPLYRSQRICRPIYINRAAYKAIFKPADEPTWQEMTMVLSAIFSTTIEPEHGTGDIVATAYADRQSDPLDLSLSGNLGSGRAYYAGQMFNIKGERTPLATATKKQFSDGFLEMERAIWETVVANGLQGSISTGLNSVLAIIDMDDTCVVEWRPNPVKRAKVIRLDDGCLDRVTHLFHAPRALNSAALHETAASYGRLEADKFCERLVHGTWSPGNISLKGHLIDFDTVCATKGRGPVYSSTRWYHQNRFGFEHGGQATILGALANHADINIDQVTASELHATLKSALQEKTALNFISLMGFDDVAGIYSRHGADIDALCSLWQELSRKTYDCAAALLLKDTRAYHVHVFDTALFMAAYPLALRMTTFNAAEMLRLMMNDSLADELLTPQPQPEMSEIERHHQDAVNAVIGQHLVANTADRDMLSFAALGFIKKYDRAFRGILDGSKGDLPRLEAQALARNEDRRALFAAHTASFRLAENIAQRSDQHLNSIITQTIESCQRTGHARLPAIRYALYDEGVFKIILTGNGQHCLSFKAYGDHHQPTEIKWENEVFALDQDGNSRPRANALLWPIFMRETSLQIPEILLYSQHEHINSHFENREEWQPATPL